MATASDRPPRLNFEWRRGDEFSRTVVYPNDLTGATVVTQIYSLRTGADVTTMTTTVTPGASSSTVSVSIQESPSAALAVGTYGVRQIVTAAGSVQQTRTDGVAEVLP